MGDGRTLAPKNVAGLLGVSHTYARFTILSKTRIQDLTCMRIESSRLSEVDGDVSLSL